MQLFFHRILFSGLLAFIFNSNTLSSQLLIPEIPSSEDVRLDQELVAATEPIIEKKAQEKEKLSESLQKEIEKTCTAMLSAKNNKQSEAFAAKLQRLFDLKRQAEAQEKREKMLSYLSPATQAAILEAESGFLHVMSRLSLAGLVEEAVDAVQNDLSMIEKGVLDQETEQELEHLFTGLRQSLENGSFVALLSKNNKKEALTGPSEEELKQAEQFMKSFELLIPQEQKSHEQEHEQDVQEHNAEKQRVSLELSNISLDQENSRSEKKPDMLTFDNQAESSQEIDASQQTLFDMIRNELLSMKQGFSREELEKLHNLLEKTREQLSAQGLMVGDKKKSWDHLLQLFSYVHEQAIDKLSLDALAQVKPVFLDVRKKIQETLKLLQKEEAAVLASLQQELSDGTEEGLPDDPVFYWDKQLRDYKKQLTALSWLTSGTVSSSAELSQALFKQFSYAYSFVAKWLDLYVNDRALSYMVRPVTRSVGALPRELSSAPYWLNILALKPILTIWDFFNVRSLVAGKISTAVLSQQIPEELIDPQAFLVAQAMTALLCIGTTGGGMGGAGLAGHVNNLIRGSVGQVQGAPGTLPQFVQRLLTDIPTVWLYYHVIHCYTFEADSSSLFHDNDGAALWPAHYRHMIPVIAHGIVAGENFIAGKINGYLYKNTTPELMNQLEEYSLGLVNPDLIPFIGKILLPSIVFSGLPAATGHSIREIAHLQENDLRSWLSWTSIPLFLQRMFGNMSPQQPVQNRSRFFGWLPDFSRLLPRFFGIQQAGQRSRAVGNSDEAFYLETQLYFYLLSRVGGHLGKKIAIWQKEPLLQAGVSTAKGLITGAGMVGLLDADEAQELSAGFSTNLEFFKIQLIEGLEMALTPGSPVHEQARFYLGGAHKSSAKVNEETVAQGFDMLARGNVISNSDAHRLMRSFIQKPDDIHAFAEQIIEAVVDHQVRKVGEWSGSITAQLAGSYAMHHYGPFYPRIKAALT